MCLSVPSCGCAAGERRGRQQCRGLTLLGREVPAPSQASGFLDLALPQACWAEIGLPPQKQALGVVSGFISLLSAPFPYQTLNWHGAVDWRWGVGLRYLQAAVKTSVYIS